jgi:hypothetical protein
VTLNVEALMRAKRILDAAEVRSTTFVPFASIEAMQETLRETKDEQERYIINQLIEHGQVTI